MEHKTLKIEQAGRIFICNSEKITYEQAQRVRAIIAHAAELMEKPPATISSFEACGLDTWKLRALSHIFLEMIGDTVIEYSAEKARATYSFLKNYYGNFDLLDEALEIFLERAGASTLASLMLRRDTLLLLQKYAQMAITSPQTHNLSGINTPLNDDTTLTGSTN
jgi:hypothetical protein